MTRTRGSTKQHSLIMQQIVHRIYHKYNYYTPEGKDAFIDMATWVTNLSVERIAAIRREFDCHPDCKGEMNFEVEERSHVSSGTQSLMDTTLHILEAADECMTVDQIVDAVNVYQREHHDPPQVMTKRRCYEIIDLLGYSSKKISGVLGASYAGTQAKRDEDMRTLLPQLARYKNLNNFVFVDESSLELATLYSKTRGVSLKGEPAFGKLINTYTGDKDDVLNMIVFITISEPIHIVFLDRANTKTSFETAMRDYWENSSMDEIHFMVDNVYIHSKELMEGLAESLEGVTYSFIPRYSPDANAAECVHDPLKREIVKELTKMKAITGRTMKSKCKQVCESFEMPQEERINCVKFAMDIIAAMKTLPYDEAVRSVKRKAHGHQ